MNTVFPLMPWKKLHSRKKKKDKKKIQIFYIFTKKKSPSISEPERWSSH